MRTLVEARSSPRAGVQSPTPGSNQPPRAHCDRTTQVAAPSLQPGWATWRLVACASATCQPRLVVEPCGQSLASSAPRSPRTSWQSHHHHAHPTTLRLFSPAQHSRFRAWPPASPHGPELQPADLKRPTRCVQRLPIASTAPTTARNTVPKSKPKTERKTGRPLAQHQRSQSSLRAAPERRHQVGLQVVSASARTSWVEWATTASPTCTTTS